MITVDFFFVYWPGHTHEIQQPFSISAQHFDASLEMLFSL